MMLTTTTTVCWRKSCTHITNIMAVKFTVRCLKCGKTRDTYNDPRLRRSVIECKASCFESHYEWEFVEEFDESAASPQVPSNPPASVAVAAPTTGPVVGTSPESQAAPAPKQAFVEEKQEVKLEQPPPPQRQQRTSSTAAAPPVEQDNAEPSKKRSGICVML
ncbi:Hypothetical protein, putative [Bodo saltans]|uniref:Uncharacterized protein n=1 Tax=Bodo saltans TaxID=75058 RepID=A0A0S4JFV7_BODSA|nr:Hypothetical protein, putative [Bodo saltans]|eukprot:CUG90334.1 Hypothetical protein, putative [Bodo saltans]